MKKIIFSLAFMLIGSVAFANTVTPLEKTSEISFNNLCFQDLKFIEINHDDVLDTNIQVIEIEDCTITTDVTITKDGKKTTVKGTVKIEGQSCAELLKTLIK